MCIPVCNELRSLLACDCVDEFILKMVYFEPGDTLLQYSEVPQRHPITIELIVNTEAQVSEPLHLHLARHLSFDYID